MGNEVAKRDAFEVFRSLDFNRPQDLAGVFVRSGFFKDTRDMSQAAVKVLMGHEIGIPPVTAMLGIDFINGNLRIRSNVLASMVKASEQYDYRVREHTDRICRIEFFQREEKGAPWESLGTAEFTYEEAERAGLFRNKVWKDWTKNMLFARAMSNGVSTFCPDVSKTGARVYTEGDSFGANDAGYAERVDDPGEFIDAETGEVTPLADAPDEPPVPEDPSFGEDPGLHDIPGKDDPPADALSEKQGKMIYALRRKVFQEDSDYRAWLEGGWGVSTSKALTKKQASKVIEALVALNESAEGER